MEISSRSAASAAAQPATIYLALELSRASWVVAVHAPLADKIGLHKLKAGDGEGLLALIARLRGRLERTLGRPVAVVSCYEAGYDGFWLHRLLEAHGARNHVLDPASLQVNRRARRVKTDRIDAASLLRALMAHLRGEPKVVSVVRVPSVAEEDARRLHRERHRLVGERVQHVTRIKGLLATQGVYDFQPLRRDRWQRLGALRTGDGRALPPRLAAELARELRRLELVLEMIASLEAERDAIAAAPAPAHPHAPKIQALARLKGIGAEFATVLVGEVFHRQFDNRRQVASYVGLTPSPFCSGGLAREQGISKAGNPKARTTMVELAWLWLRHQPESALSQWFRQRVGVARGRLRRLPGSQRRPPVVGAERQAAAALARKLLVALWRYLATGLVPDGAVLKG
jgi:transposase